MSLMSTAVAISSDHPHLSRLSCCLLDEGSDKSKSMSSFHLFNANHPPGEPGRCPLLRLNRLGEVKSEESV